MSYKIDIRTIFSDHIDTLVNASTKKPDLRDWFFFLILPLVISVYLVYEGVFVSEDRANSLISGLSIYVGLSINFLMLIFELSTKQFFKEQDRIPKLKQVIANISVTTLYSLFIIVLTLLTDIEILKCAIHILLYFLLLEFFFTMLMVLKRIYNILIGTMSNDIHD
jgi:hypothetical protein